MDGMGGVHLDYRILWKLPSLKALSAFFVEEKLSDAELKVF